MRKLTPRESLLAAVLAVILFHLGFSSESFAGPAIFLYLGAMVFLTQLSTPRLAFGVGWLVGVATFTPQLTFFWIFRGPVGVMMWFVLALFPAVFLWLGRTMIGRWPTYGMFLIPVVWLGLEWIRCEYVYPWLTPGHALTSPIWSWMLRVGALGVGCVWVLVHSARLSPNKMLRAAIPVAIGVAFVVALMVTMQIRAVDVAETDSSLVVAGAQVEGKLSKDGVISPPESRVFEALENAKADFPDARILVLPEYAIQGAPSPVIRDWARTHRKVVVVGGRQYLENGQFYNTVFIIKDNGEVKYSQGKCHPVPFANDGLPTKSPEIWWDGYGAIGILVCYDMSFPSLTDEIVRQGAGALIVPSLDFAGWGENEHRKERQMAQVVAAEHGISVFRVNSSGYSVLVDRWGQIKSLAPFPRELATLGGSLEFAWGRGIPPDRLIYKPAAAVTGGLLVWILGAIVVAQGRTIADSLRYRRTRRRRLKGIGRKVPA